MYVYRNKTQPDQVVSYPERSARLDRLDNWELVDDADVPERAEMGHRMAGAEARSIEEAAARRLDVTKAIAEGSVNAATVRERSADGAAQPYPTASTFGPTGHQPVGVLDKEHNARATDPVIAFDENARAAAEEIKNPPTSGVLKRAKADQKTGRTQIGTQAAKAAAADTSGDTTPAEADAAAEEATPTGPPAKSAPKQAWVDYAVSQGMSREDADAATIAQLQAQYGSGGGDAPAGSPAV